MGAGTAQRVRPRESYSNKYHIYFGCRMTIAEVRIHYVDKENIPCPLTEKLVKAGYQQRSGGYIDNARKEGIEVDYTQNKPSQYWHLMSYCIRTDDSKSFGKTIVCGELIFWMAEVANCVPYDELNNLVERIIKSSDRCVDGRPIYDRRKWNRKIQDLCFDRIVTHSAQQIATPHSQGENRPLCAL